MAGLPKSGRWLLLLASFLLCLSAVAAAQTVDPPLIEEQTPSDTLQPLVDGVALNAVATDAQESELVSAFSAVIAAEKLTLDQALAMLALVSWETLETAEDVTAAMAAITAVLQGVADGTLAGDPLAALADLVAAAVAPAGVRNAIARAGGSEELLEQVDELVTQGVPPGILVRLAKQSLRDGLAEEDVTALYDALAIGADGGSWGRLVNEITSDPSNEEPNAGRNRNENSGTDATEEQENQENQHGHGNGGKKS